MSSRSRRCTAGRSETAAEALNVVSSAYMSTIDRGTARGRSFTKIINNSGLKTDPWGTPCVTSLCSESRSQVGGVPWMLHHMPQALIKGCHGQLSQLSQCYVFF